MLQLTLIVGFAFAVIVVGMMIVRALQDKNMRLK